MLSLALGAIGVYRRYLSPLKGFRCAHHAVHHRGSCSDFGLRVYKRHPFAMATGLLVIRLQDCRRAYNLYLSQASEEPVEDGAPPRRKSNGADICHPLDALNCISFVPDSACADLGVCDCLGGLSF